MITIGYRLAVWGFLGTGNDIESGNFGLWDQHVPHQWISQNIQAFGGDQNKVTLAGQSAGTSSVVYQSLFSKNEGIFQRGIALAGSITCPRHTILNTLICCIGLGIFLAAIQKHHLLTL